MKIWPHITLGILAFLFAFLGSGYRHLWMDEMETAERARTILESGYPRVIDESGEVSLFTGGKEIEDGVAHRYTPWVQFYVGAAGLAIGQPLGISKDASLRLPFAMSHGGMAFLTSFGLNSLAAVSLPVSLGVGLLVSLQTERLLHNRTARYHALLDFFVLLGLFGLGKIRVGKRIGFPLVALSIFILPHIHSLAGILFGFVIGSTMLTLTREKKYIFSYALLPGLVSIGLLFLQTRPWAQQAWGTLNPFDFMAMLRTQKRLRYAYYFLFISIILMAAYRQKKISMGLGVIFLSLIVGSLIVDRHPYSQLRYYLSLPLICLLWSIVFGFGSINATQKKTLLLGLFLILLIPEFTTRRFSAFQGIRVVLDDIQKDWKNVEQPYHEAIAYIKENGHAGNPVLIDFVPMYRNWYLPKFKGALMPDDTDKTKLNANNPIWQKPIHMPTWHLLMAAHRGGETTFGRSGNYRIENFDLENKRYSLTSEKLGKTNIMCIIKSWETVMEINAPFELFHEESFTPSGQAVDTLVLAKACD